MTRFLFSAAAVAALSLSTLSAQSFETVRVTFDQSVEVAGNVVPAGNYTITEIKLNGEGPLLRFQSDHGVNVVVIASREDRAIDHVAPRTDVVLDTTGPVEQVARIQIAGSLTDYIIPLTHHAN